MSELAEKIAREVQPDIENAPQLSKARRDDIVAIIDRHLEPSPHEQLRTDIETVIHEHSNAYPIENFSRLTRGLIKMLRTKYFMR